MRKDVIIKRIRIYPLTAEQECVGVANKPYTAPMRRHRTGVYRAEETELESFLNFMKGCKPDE